MKYLLILVILLFPSLAKAEGVIIGDTGYAQWDALPDADLQGYKMYLGNSCNLFDQVRDVGLTPTPTLPTFGILDAFGPLTDGQYCLKVTGYDFVGEGADSNLVPFVYDGTRPGPPVVIVVPSK